MTISSARRAIFSAAAALTLVSTLSSTASAEDVTLTYRVGSTAEVVATATRMIADFEAANPDIKIKMETGPGGAEGDNIVKTRLATGDMTDLFVYNTGSLFQAINPIQNLVDVTNEPWQANVLNSFKVTVTGTDGKIYGAPIGAAMGGGILYNIPIYKDLGLSIPKTWAEFMANNEKIKAAGKVPVIQSFGTTWTSQLFVLADFFNVQAQVPTFAADYTAGKAKYATTPAAMAGFQHGEDVFKAGYLNDDFAAATFEEAVTKIATGEGAHYPMLTFAVSTVQQLSPENVKNVGFFALPGNDAAKNGLTVWEPGGIYIAKTTKHPEEAKKFLAFAASVAGCESQTAAVGPTGPYVIKGCKLPENVPPVVADLLPYFQSDATTAPALEFVSPIKGPSLEQITVEVGSGFRPAADGAALYDEDVRKQAMQLGLPGWK